MSTVISPPQSQSNPFPSATSPSLILTHPTPAERRRTWSLTHPVWGPALSEDDYLRREEYLTTVPLAKNGGITHWILTDSDLPPGQRRVYASCETLRKPALACGPETGGEVREGVAHGVGSVFTEEKCRGRGYATRMMEDLGRRLRDWDRAKDDGGSGNALLVNGADSSSEPGKPTSLFSVLYSDIGKKFYARTGWGPFSSSHVEFPPLPSETSLADTESDAGGGLAASNAAKPIGYSELAELCAVDEALLRARLAQQAASPTSSDHFGTKKTCVALIPDHDTMLWHLAREDFMTQHIFHKSPAIKGAVFGTEPGKRVWGVWTRTYYGNLEKDSGNTLYFLRFVVEDEKAAGEEYLIEAVRAIVQTARAEAAPWACKKVNMWNPEPSVKAAIEKSGLPFQFVERDSESIASLLWFGRTPVGDLDWVLNEKYGWC